MKAFFNKNKKVVLISGGIIALGILAFVIIKKKNKGIVPGIEGSLLSAPGVSWPLKRKAGAETNSSEQEVIKKLQQYLNSKMTMLELPLSVDGYFGSNTEFQAQKILGVKTISYSLYNEIITTYKTK